MKGTLLKLFIDYSQLNEVIRTSNKKTRILFKNGDSIELGNGRGLKIYKQLCRNFPGEHL